MSPPRVGDSPNGREMALSKVHHQHLNLHSNVSTKFGFFCAGGEPAGDLFGPYILTIPKEPEHDPRDPKDSDVAAEQKKKGGGKQASLRAVGAADQFIKDLGKKVGAFVWNMSSSRLPLYGFLLPFVFLFPEQEASASR